MGHIRLSGSGKMREQFILTHRLENVRIVGADAVGQKLHADIT
jgi:hypothetical protein